ncbi:MAG: protein kinase, partial [Myxococcota bacterium]
MGATSGLSGGARKDAIAHKLTPVWRHPLAEMFVSGEPGSGRQLLLAFLRPGIAASESSKKSCMATCHILRKQRSSFVYPVAQARRIPDGRLVLAGDMIVGTSLDEHIAKGAFSAERAIPILRQICHALDVAHGMGMTHGALTTSSVLLERRDRRDDAVRLADFGLADEITADCLSDELAALQPLSPELLDDEMIEPRRDIYLLGAVAYAMLAGRPVFDGTPDIIREAHALGTPEMLEVDGPLREVVMQCLQKNPDARFESVRDVERAFRDAQAKMKLETPWDDLHTAGESGTWGGAAALDDPPSDPDQAAARIPSGPFEIVDGNPKPPSERSDSLTRPAIGNGIEKARARIGTAAVPGRPRQTPPAKKRPSGSLGATPPPPPKPGRRRTLFGPPGQGPAPPPPPPSPATARAPASKRPSTSTLPAPNPPSPSAKPSEKPSEKPSASASPRATAKPTAATAPKKASTSPLASPGEYSHSSRNAPERLTFVPAEKKVPAAPRSSAEASDTKAADLRGTPKTAAKPLSPGVKSGSAAEAAAAVAAEIAEEGSLPSPSGWGLDQPKPKDAPKLETKGLGLPLPSTSKARAYLSRGPAPAKARLPKPRSLEPEGGDEPEPAAGFTGATPGAAFDDDDDAQTVIRERPFTPFMADPSASDDAPIGNTFVPPGSTDATDDEAQARGNTVVAAMMPAMPEVTQVGPPPTTSTGTVVRRAPVAGDDDDTAAVAKLSRREDDDDRKRGGMPMWIWGVGGAAAAAVLVGWVAMSGAGPGTPEAPSTAAKASQEPTKAKASPASGAAG